MPEATNRRAVLGAVLAAGALAAVPSRVAAADVDVEPGLQALIAAWRDAKDLLEETLDAYCAADERARCPVPRALIATEGDTKFFDFAVPGRPYQASDLTQFRAWKHLAERIGEILSDIPGISEYSDRVAEIVAAWDEWEAERRAAQEREGVSEAEAIWSHALSDFEDAACRLAKFRAQTMEGVLAKLLVAASVGGAADLDDKSNSWAALLAGAAFDARALAEAGR